jgi:energy-coupling factor transporter transmembrane protein EcfT
MHSLDAVARASSWGQHPSAVRTACLMLVLVVIVLCPPGFTAPILAVATLLAGVTVGRVPLSALLAAWRWPAVVILVSSLPLMLASNTEATIGITLDASRAVSAIVRALSAALVGVTLACSTPVHVLLAHARRAGLPAASVELLWLTERYVHELVHTWESLRRAQHARGLGRSGRATRQALGEALATILGRTEARAARCIPLLAMRGGADALIRHTATR